MLCAGLDCFDGYLVTYDEPCQSSDVPKEGQPLAGDSKQQQAFQQSPHDPVPSRGQCRHQKPLHASFKKPQRAQLPEFGKKRKKPDLPPLDAEVAGTLAVSPADDKTSDIRSGIYSLLPSSNVHEHQQHCLKVVALQNTKSSQNGGIH